MRKNKKFSVLTPIGFGVQTTRTRRKKKRGKKAHRREFDPIQRSRHVSAGFLRVFVQKQRRAASSSPVVEDTEVSSVGAR